MPYEYLLLKGQPVQLQSCPNCGVAPFIPFLRGQVQRSSRPWYRPWHRRPYCALVCETCKEIVGYEDPLPVPRFPLPQDGHYPAWCGHHAGVLIDGGLNCSCCGYFVPEVVSLPLDQHCEREDEMPHLTRVWEEEDSRGL